MSYQARILIVDDEKDFAKGICRHVEASFPDFKTDLAFSGKDALKKISEFRPDIVLLDLLMPDIDGHEVLPKALKILPDLSVIILTAHGTVETAVQSIKAGAWDFITKPVKNEDLIRSLNKALERSKLLGENKRLTELMSQSGIDRRIIGDSPEMQRLKESTSAVAKTHYTVLVQGESGTGKELVAESVHNLSDRTAKPLLRVNCPAIPEHLLESELFGHVKGSFTGALHNRQGMFLEASGGTLILDEIGDMPINVQIKLLRVLQDGEVRPVGSGQTIHADTRVIAVTNQNLEEKIRKGSFREDLYYRLKVLTLVSPPLRDRKEDIPLLAMHFLKNTCKELGLPEKSFSPELMAMLMSRDWQGNVRELQNTIRRMTVFAQSEILDIKHLNIDGMGLIKEEEAPGTVLYKDAKQSTIEAFTREYLDMILSKTGGNVSQAAKMSGLERVSLQKIIRRMDFDVDSYRNN